MKKALSGPNFAFNNVVIDGKLSIDGRDLPYCPQSIMMAGVGLTSLEGFPRHIYELDLHDNLITSFKYAPEKIDNIFDVRRNDITSLKGCPKDVGNLFLDENKIHELDEKGIICDKKLSLKYNGLRSLHNIHIAFPYVGCNIDISNNPITSSILGLFLIECVNAVQCYPNILDCYPTTLPYRLIQYINEYMKNTASLTGSNKKNNFIKWRKTYWYSSPPKEN